MPRDRNPDLPKLPRFKADDIQLNSSSLVTVLSQYRDQRITPELALRMAIDANKVLPDVPEYHLHQTFIQYVGQLVDDKLSRLLAAQLAAREHELMAGPIVSYDRPTKPEWVAMTVNWVEPSTWKTDQAGTLFHFLVLSGHPAGHILKRKFPDTWLNFFAYRLGFSRRIEYDLEPKHFIGLRLWGYLCPVEDSPDIRFEDWDLSSAFKKHNLHVIRLRTRLDYSLADCPKGYEHHCFDCQTGRDECPASCLPTSTSHQPSSTQATKPG